MRFEQIVEELYKKYTQAVSKEEKMKKIEEKARELGFENVEVQFNEKTAEARAIVELNEETISEEKLRKLEEVAEWVVGANFSVYSIKVLITTAKIERNNISENVLEKASEIGLNYIKYKRIAISNYVDVFELERNDVSGVFVYLLIYNEESS